jgi:hypothetical protein
MLYNLRTSILQRIYKRGVKRNHAWIWASILFPNANIISEHYSVTKQSNNKYNNPNTLIVLRFDDNDMIYEFTILY